MSIESGVTSPEAPRGNPVKESIIYYERDGGYSLMTGKKSLIVQGVVKNPEITHKSQCR